MWDIRVIDVRAVDGTRRPRGQHVREVDVREVDVREVDVREIDIREVDVREVDVRGRRGRRSGVSGSTWGHGAVAGLTRCAAGARAANVMDVIAIVRMRSFVVVACCVIASNRRGKENIDVSHLFLPIVFWD